MTIDQNTRDEWLLRALTPEGTSSPGGADVEKHRRGGNIKVSASQLRGIEQIATLGDGGELSDR